MMDMSLRERYVAVLKDELIPAMGCTELIALAYAAAIIKQTLETMPVFSTVTVSGNIIKNVKSVIVPHTGGMRGIEAAVAAGFIVGNPDAKLEVLSGMTEADILKLSSYLHKNQILVKQSDSKNLFEIIIEAKSEQDTARVVLLDGHTNIVSVEKNGSIIYRAENARIHETKDIDKSFLSVEGIVAYAKEVPLDDVRELLDRQIRYNTAIAEEGMKNSYGADIGKILIKTYGNSVNVRAKALAAAGSDARMSGCELPVVINSGSGNQGITCSLPVIVFAKELQVSKEQLYRALLISNLVTIHLKTGIGCLSAYCGAISAGCGAGAGITYLFGGGYKEIAHTIVNAVAINSGVVCDGAKPSCAAKIASAVEAGLVGMYMYMHGSQFFSGDGIVKADVEKTIENVSVLARDGMRETDREILRIMLEC